MAYLKRRSAILEEALARLQGLQTGQSFIDLGNGLTLQVYADLIEASKLRLQAHNMALSEADRTRIKFAEVEASLAALSSRVLTAVAAAYGRDSKEYEMAGGKPPGTYRRVKKTAPATGLNESQPSYSSALPSNGFATNGASTTT